MSKAAALPAELTAPGIDVVFIAPDDTTGGRGGAHQRTVSFAPGEPIPRVGECVIIALGGPAARWQVEDVAHVFEDRGHGIAIKLAPPPA
ncbi:hypothetical protein Q8W71_12765 [Methylobacterium sp. NEAU 140]|uniref:hypothetical protein n=1 Tax=Methylobacterium sp. NEAU 140 TaxID=3064945 RepID=UPI002735D397|nr:hypothetical protein [Methylobacterium sp. NEAU 140]MDP4023502.1 hypothetical protein [Methylobacterium sp. NEAU 140]